MARTPGYNGANSAIPTPIQLLKHKGGWKHANRMFFTMPFASSLVRKATFNI
jgi:hypothetical protein